MRETLPFALALVLIAAGCASHQIPSYVLPPGSTSQGSASGLSAANPGPRAWVVDCACRQGEHFAISVLDLTTRKVLKTLRVAGVDDSIVATRDGRTVYFPESSSRSLGSIDTRTYAVSRLAIGLNGNYGYRSIDVSPDGRFVYLGDASVYVVDVVQKRIVHTITYGWASTAHSMIVSPNGAVLFENYLGTTPLENGILAIDSSTYEIISKFSVPNGNGHLAVSSNGRYLFETTWASPTAGVSIVDTVTGKILGHVAFNGFPYDIALDDTLQRVYVANQAGAGLHKKGQVVVIDILSGKVIKSISDLNQPVYLGIEHQSHDIYGADCCLPNPGVTRILPDSFRKYRYPRRLFPGDPQALAITE
jgi:DNA-binding beta-propeller fold protein YncE